jgi:membrane protease YdiL (CAAX protease family)
MNVEGPGPGLQLPTPDGRARPTVLERTVALLEVVLCSDYLTQLALAATFHLVGLRPFTAAGQLSAAYVVALSLADTALLVGLMLLFLRSHGERARDVFLGRRSIAGEVVVGAPLALVALAVGAGVLAVVMSVAPWLHDVPHNPLEDLIREPREAWLFALVVVVAGGVREELQRAFVLHRFEVWLGGGAVGVIVGSVAFGAGHLLQGTDAAITTGVLGVFWGIVYLRRRSAVAPMVSHAGFDLLQIVQYVMTRT